MGSLVKQLSPTLFWDVKIEELKPQLHQKFIIGRVLSFGSLNDWRLIQKIYNKRLIKKAVNQVRDLDPKSKSFWQVVLE